MRSYHLLAALLATLTALLIAPGEARSTERWQWPVGGEVVRGFSTTENRFAAGQHRGIDIATRPGAGVRAACPGRVTFAGRLPGGARGVTIACGDLAATHLGLATTRVRRGATARAGETIGTAATDHVQLGARRHADRFGYLDPLRLLAPDPPPLGAAPARGRPRGEGPRAETRAESAGATAPETRAVSPLAFAGVALLLAALPAGGLAAGRRRRARSAATRRRQASAY
jgi:hypothetical protein